MTAGLTDREEAFVREYIKDFKPKEAARRAGYDHVRASAAASALLKRPRVKQAIKLHKDALARRSNITQDRIVQELARIAFGDLRGVVAWGSSGLTVRESGEITEGDAAAISEVSESVTVAGRGLRIKRHDKVKALELLGRHLGMWNDKLTIGGELNVLALEKGRERAKERI